jgi:hypothetical protein
MQYYSARNLETTVREMKKREVDQAKKSQSPSGKQKYLNITGTQQQKSLQTRGAAIRITCPPARASHSRGRCNARCLPLPPHIIPAKLAVAARCRSGLEAHVAAACSASWNVSRWQQELKRLA